MRATVVLIAALALTGCSATVEQEIFEPVLRSEPDARPYMRGATRISLGEATLFLYAVAFSERMKTVYGPLLILPTPWEEMKPLDRPLVLRIGIEAPGGTATVDLSKTAVTLGSRTLYPTSVASYGKKLDQPAHVAGQLSLRGRPAAYTFELSYSIRTTELEPFTVQLPDIQVNGRVVPVKPVEFGRGKREVVQL